MASEDETWFGWRRNFFGPATPWKGVKPYSTTKMRTDDMDYPNTQMRKLTDDEKELSLAELRVKYPYEKPAE